MSKLNNLQLRGHWFKRTQPWGNGFCPNAFTIHLNNNGVVLFARGSKISKTKPASVLLYQYPIYKAFCSLSASSCQHLLNDLVVIILGQVAASTSYPLNAPSAGTNCYPTIPPSEDVEAYAVSWNHNWRFFVDFSKLYSNAHLLYACMSKKAFFLSRQQTTYVVVV